MSEKVLLVDDEKDFVEVLAQRLQSREIVVDVALDGYQALRLAKENSYDAIILDMMMPGIDGLDTLKLLLEDNPNAQVYLLTGHATLEKGVEAMKLGAKDFFEKPIMLQTLVDKIQEAKSKRLELVEKKAESIIERIWKSKSW